MIKIKKYHELWLTKSLRYMDFRNESHFMAQEQNDLFYVLTRISERNKTRTQSANI